LTDNGICYTFNGVKSGLTFQSGIDYIDAFEDVFGVKEHEFSRKSFKANGIGVQNGLSLILDSHVLTGRYSYQELWFFL
jgi:hypothetical protein